MSDAPLVEKVPLQSKKFVAFLVGEATWKVILGVILIVMLLGIKNDASDLFLGVMSGIALSIVLIAGAIEALYIGGQAGLDKYTRIAQIAVNAGQAFTMKNVRSSHALPLTEPDLSPDKDTDEKG